MANQKNNIKIIQCNKGNSEFFNRIAQLKLIIEEQKPQILVINEANLRKEDKISEFKFDNYTMEKDGLAIKSGKHRTVMLIHHDINYTRCKKT